MSAPATSTRVRAATHEDLPAVLTAVADLLSELGSRPPDAAPMLETAQALLEDPRLGALLLAEVAGGSSAEADGEGAIEAHGGSVAETDGQDAAAVIGVLSASYQLALHVPGRYALIQDLWVHPSWRGRTVGRELLDALFELARAQGMARAEVGLPRERFAGIRATERFYVRNGFEHLGPRMRRVFP